MKPLDHRKAAPRRTYLLVLTGELADFHVTMGAMSGHDLVAVRSGDLAETEVVKLVASRVVTHDFDIADLMDLDYWVLVDILAAWGRAMEEEANPPANGGR